MTDDNFDDDIFAEHFSRPTPAQWKRDLAAWQSTVNARPWRIEGGPCETELADRLNDYFSVPQYPDTNLVKGVDDFFCYWNPATEKYKRVRVRKLYAILRGWSRGAHPFRLNLQTYKNVIELAAHFCWIGGHPHRE